MNGSKPEKMSAHLSGRLRELIEGGGWENVGMVKTRTSSDWGIRDEEFQPRHLPSHTQNSS